MPKPAAPKPKRGAAKPKAAKAARQKKAAHPTEPIPTPPKAPPPRKAEPGRAKPAAVKPDPNPATVQEQPAEAPKDAEAKDEPLSAKHEKFAQCLALGMSQAAAYRGAISSSAKPETVYAESSRLAADPKVSTRVEELRKEAKARAGAKFAYEYEHAMAELDSAYRVAMLLGDSSAMSKAVMGKVEISGLKVDPRSNARDPFENVTDEELEQQTQRAAKEAGLTIQSAGGPLH